MDELSFNFTKDQLAKIEPPRTGRDSYKDTKERGLILLVSYGGSKVFYLYKKINNKVYRLKIGNFPELSISEAREEAAKLKLQIAKKTSLTEKKTNLISKMTFKQFLDKYIEDYAKHSIKRWYHIVPTLDRQAYILYDQKISTIQREDIQALFNKLTIETGKTSANRFIERLCSMFNRAADWGWEGKNPTNGIKKHKERSRDRYLTAEEKAKFFEALEEEQNETVRDFVLVSLYTGARKSNVLSMRWENISFEKDTWYIPNTKNGEPQLVALLDVVVGLLKERKKNSKSDWVFPSNTSKSGHLQEPKKVWARILTKAGIKDLRIHDLRRTLGSWMAAAGASQYIIGKALNHKSPKSTAIYARLELDPVKEFMNKAKNNLTE